MVAREHYSTSEKEVDKLNRGAKRSHVFVTHLETQSVVNSFANAYIEKKSRINTDESNAYGELLLNYDLRTVNHKKEYRSDLGVPNNQAESFFSRFKRMHYGQTHIYRHRYKLFKGKIRKYLVQIMRDEPNKAFTITELTLRIFDIEQTQGIPSEKHLDSVRKQLNAFYQRGWITRTQISRREVYW